MVPDRPRPVQGDTITRLQDAGPGRAAKWDKKEKRAASKGGSKS
jgi:hypothetical protein